MWWRKRWKENDYGVISGPNQKYLFVELLILKSVKSLDYRYIDRGVAATTTAKFDRLLFRRELETKFLFKSYTWLCRKLNPIRDLKV